MYERLVLKHQCAFLRTPFLTEHFQWLLLTVSGFQPATLLKKRLRQRCLSVNFAKTFKNILRQKHLRMTASCAYLWILRSFSGHLFYRAPLGNCLFHLQVAQFQPPHTVKKYLLSAFQAFILKDKVAIRKSYVLKIPKNYLWRSYL